MKQLSRLTAILLIFLLAISAVPSAAATSSVTRVTIGGSGRNEHFAELSPALSGHISAPLYYAPSSGKAVIYESDETTVSATIRQAMTERKESFAVYYQADYALPTQGQAANDAAFAIAKNLLEGALAETDQPTEGDSLRYCFYSWSYGGEMKVYPNKTELILHYTPSYFTTKAQEDEMSAEVDKVVGGFGFTEDTSQLRKIEVIYDYITDNVRYDYDNLNDENYVLKYSAYAALINKTAVCEGYAVLFYRLAEECGLDARVITGLGGNPGEAHGWNIVGLGNAYYYLDSTWDAGQSTYAFFLKGRNDFPLHINDTQFDDATFYNAYPIPDTGYQYTTDPDGTEYTSGDFKYVLNSGSAVITDYIGQEADVTVPAVLDGYTVKSIGYQAFYAKSSIRKLTISEGIRTLSVQAISYCNELTELHLPTTLSIPDTLSSGLTAVPTDCPHLAEITVAAGNPYLKVTDGVLYTADMKTLLLCPPADGKTKFIVPDGVTVIANSAFADHQTLKEVVMPESIKTIGYFAFCAAYELEKADIPAKCEKICQYIYTETKVSALHIPASVTTILPCAFEMCDLQSLSIDPANPVFTVENGMLHDGKRVLTSAVSTVGAVTVPDGITEIENGAFRNAESITAFSLPASLRQIGDSAFHGCSALTHLQVPEGVTDIGDIAFGSCDKLVSIIIPESVETFEEFLFHPYKHVTVYGGSKAQEVAWSEGVNYKALSQFTCGGGHVLEETVTEDDDYHRYYHYACSVCGGQTKEYVHYYPHLSDAELTISFTEAVYTGDPIAPEIVSVTYKGKLLKENVDYTATIPTTIADAGEYSVLIKGIGAYRGGKSATYTIRHADISEAEIIMPQTEFLYEGSAIRPEFTVRWRGKELTRYEDYGFVYENNNKEGVAVLVVTGNQNFIGEIRKEFTIGEHEHHYSSTEIDDKNHYGLCTCGRTTPAEQHRYDNDCDYYCNDCYYYRAVEHSSGDNWNGDLWRHYRQCSACGEVCDLGNHVGGQATCSAAAICDICHLAYGDTLPHDWDMNTLKSDPTYHWNPCKNCSAGEYHERHHGGNATCSTPAKCVDCGEVYGNTTAHNFAGAVISVNSQGHTIGCTDCSAVSATRTHSFHNSKCTVCGYTAPKPTTVNPFTDVKKSDYFIAPVLWAVENGVTSGTSKNTFSPDDFCTRAQVVTFLWRAAGSPTPAKGRNPFTDVKNGQYYYNAVLWAVAEGITSGVSADRFAPEDTCTRGQIVAFLYRFAGQPQAAGNNPFADVKSNQYYYKAVLWAVKSNITTGVDATHFAPEDTCTRAQVVTFLYRHIK